MEIFLSWSKDWSQELTKAFRDWIPYVLQDVSPFMSAADIALGTNWNEKINSQLEKSTIGILFVTPENIDSSWLNFEAGALSKSLEKGSKIIPILFGDKDINIKLSGSPLKQFQSVIHPDKKGFENLIGTLNDSSENPLDQEKISKTFEKWWPDFETNLNSINKKYDTVKSDTQEVTGNSLQNSEALIYNISDKLDILLRKPNGTFIEQDPTFYQAIGEIMTIREKLDMFANQALLSGLDKSTLGNLLIQMDGPLKYIKSKQR